MRWFGRKVYGLGGDPPQSPCATEASSIGPMRHPVPDNATAGDTVTRPSSAVWVSTDRGSGVVPIALG